MMITACLTTSFLQEILLAVHDLSTDTLKVALYGNSATLGPATTAYTTAGEVVGTGYTAGGQTLAGVLVQSAPGVAYVDFSNPTWTGTFSTRGALIYNASKADRSIAVLDFGVDQVVVGQPFLIQAPPDNPQTAIIRIQF
jgi:hypothetical protein